MDNTEILKNIERLQYAIDMYIAKGRVIFQNESDLKLLEEIYDQITGRQYSFCKSCGGSAIHEALIIVNNYKNRELKKMEAEAIEMTKSVFAPNSTKAKNENGGNVIVNFSDENTIVEEVLNDVIQVYTDNAETIEPEIPAEIKAEPKPKTKANARKRK